MLRSLWHAQTILHATHGGAAKVGIIAVVGTLIIAINAAKDLLHLVEIIPSCLQNHLTCLGQRYRPASVWFSLQHSHPFILAPAKIRSLESLLYLSCDPWQIHASAYHASDHFLSFAKPIRSTRKEWRKCDREQWSGTAAGLLELRGMNKSGAGIGCHWRMPRTWPNASKLDSIGHLVGRCCVWPTLSMVFVVLMPFLGLDKHAFVQRILFGVISKNFNQVLSRTQRDSQCCIKWFM